MTQPGRRVLGHLLFHPRIGLSWILFALTALVSALLLIETNHPPLTKPAAVRVNQRTSAPEKQTNAAKKKAGRKASRATKAPANAVQQPVAKEWVARTNGEIAYSSLRNGYIAWSLFWGVPAVLAMLLRIVRQSLSSSTSMLTSGVLYVAGALPALVVGALAIAGGVFYSIFGGGLVHFLVYWYRLSARTVAGAQAVPAFAPPAQPVLHANPALDDAQQRLRTITDLYQSGAISADEYAAGRRKIIDEIASGRSSSSGVNAPPP